MAETLTASAPAEAPQVPLELAWVAGPAPARCAGPTDAILAEDLLRSTPALQVHVLGGAWCRQVECLTPALRAQVIEDLLGPPPVVIVIGDGCDSPEGLSLLASRRSVTVLRSALPEPQLARAIAHAARSPGSAWQTLHGVFMQVRGLGVLLSGASGVGKSRLALELLDRGHSLVADDAPRFSCEDRHTLRGCCPAPLHGFVSVRGLGVLNVVTLFGQAAVQGECPLQLIVQLALLEPAVPAALDPLYPLGHWRIVLGVPVAQVWLPVTPLCHAAVLVESLVGNHLLKSRGYDVAADFAARQRRRMDVQYP